MPNRSVEPIATAPASPSTAVVEAGNSFVPTPRQFAVLLAIYVGLHAVFRALVSEVAGIDDVDQILRAQIWSWGYGPQPPLYTWLTRIFLGVFGYHIFSMLLLKECIVFAIYLLTYANARSLTKSHAGGLLAAAALQFDPSISWESHRELTHTVLACAMVLAFLHLFLRLEDRRWSSYALFGIGSGLGVLSKYNILFVYVAVLLAGLSLQEFRPRLLNRKLWVAAALTVAICLPHLWWISGHPELAFQSVFKLKIGETWWPAVRDGLQTWVEVLVGHVGPVLAIFTLIFWRSLRQLAIRTPEEKLLLRTLLWIVGLATASIFVFKVTGFRDRYVQPVLVWLPVWFALLVRDHLTPQRLRIFLRLGGAVAVGALIAAPGRILLTEALNKHEVLNMPYRRFARDLAPLVRPADCIIAGDHGIGGNLRLWFPDKLVIDPEVGPLFPRVPTRSILVWGGARYSEPPRELLEFTQAATGKTNVVGTEAFKELLKYHHQRSMILRVARLE